MQSYSSQKFYRTTAILIASLFLLSNFSIKSETVVENTMATENKMEEDKIFINISFDEPVFKKVSIGNKTYDKVEVPGLYCIGNPGEPYLPCKTLKVLLPHGKEVDRIVWNGKEVFIGDGYKILPAGKEVPIGVKEYSLPEPDEEIYSSNDPFPESVYKNLGIQFFRGYAIFVINTFPIKYIPARGEISFYPRINFTIYLKDTGFHSPLYRGLTEDKQEVAKKVSNIGALTTYQSNNLAPSLYPGGICDPSDSYQFVIITSEALNNTAGPYNWDALISWKQSNGITATKVTVERIVACSDYWNTNPLFNDTQALIREFVKDAYLDWGTEYILLGGDADGADVGGESGDNIIPVRLLYAMSYENDKDDYIASDFYYGCLDGNYNYDGDDKWGEPNDGINGGEVDFYAEVYVGRAPVDSATELSNFVRKTIEYGDTQAAYLEKVLLVGERLDDVPTWGGDCKDEIIDGSNANGYFTVGIPSDTYVMDTLYDRTYTWSKSELISKINNNVHLINHLGHSSVGYNMKLWYTDVDNYFTNTGYFFLYSQGCYPGAFDNWHYDTDANDPGYYTDYDCIGEHYLNGEHGAFACILNSRYGWYNPGGTDSSSQRFDREFWDAVFGENIKEIGKANQDSKEDALGYYSYGTYRWCAYELNLFGDPSLQIKLPGDPQLAYNPTSHDFGNVLEGKTYETTFEIWNNETGTLSWNLNDSHSWLSYTPDNGTSTGEHDVVIVYINTTGLAEGAYSGDIIINSNGGNGAFTVTFNVSTPSIVYVDDDYNSSTPGWGYDHFASIQEGVNAVAVGGTVNVYSGVYNENVDISKTLSLIGESKSTTIINSSGSNAVSISANSVNISGFTIRNATEEGIYVESASNCNISDNIIYGNGGNGILLNLSSNNTVFANIVHNNSYDGILLENSSYNDVIKNKVYWNGIGNNGEGILLMYSNHCNITNNVAYENGEDGIILEPSSSYNNISDNEAYGNADCGILISGNSNNNTIYNNTAYNNTFDGILIEKSSGNEIIKNSIHNNSQEGIYLLFASNNTIKENFIENNNGYGIYLNSSSNNTIYNNYFNNINNAWDNSNNTWNISKTAGVNIIGGAWLGGNYWDDYNGVDVDGDGLGDTLLPYNNSIANGGDMHPLVASNFAPVANFSYVPANPTSADIIQFTDKSNDSDGSIVNWTWSFGDGNISYEKNPTHKYADNGVYNVTLTVTDDDGATNSTYKLINVENAQPTAQFKYSPADLYTIQFTDLSYDNDGSIVNYTWDFGDGNISYEQNPKHKYASSGVYSVTLTVRDDDGAADSISKNVSVWTSRKPINLWVSSGKTPAYYQVLLNISYDANMNPDFSDLRFIRYADNVTELDYWIERKVDAQWANVWVEIADNITTANKTLAWLYYGNPNATSASNGSATFLFFDDFNDGVWSDKWNIDKNTDGIGLVYQLNGKLFLRTKEVSRTISIITKNSFESSFDEYNGTILEYDAWTKYNPPYPKSKDGKLRSYIIAAASKWIASSYSGWSGNVKLYDSNGNSSLLGRTSRRTCNIHAFVSLGCNISNAWMRWKEINDPAWTEDDFNSSITTNMTTTSIKIKLELYCGGEKEGQWSQIAFDNLKLRKYHNPEPEYYIG